MKATTGKLTISNEHNDEGGCVKLEIEGKFVIVSINECMNALTMFSNMYEEDKPF